MRRRQRAIALAMNVATAIMNEGLRDALQRQLVADSLGRILGGVVAKLTAAILADDPNPVLADTTWMAGV